MRRRKDKDEEDFKEMELWEHLSELRSRLIRSIIYALAGMVIAWNSYGWLLDLLMAPAKPIFKQIGAELAWRHITEPFMAQLQISLFAGLIIAAPFITLEMWGFVAPGLTRAEKKGFYVCVPLSVAFFVLGLLCAYVALPMALGYFASFFKPGHVETFLLQNPIQYIMFVIKMELAFGIVFQMPVILMFLGYVGIVTSAGLRANWRTALVVCAVVAAIATPGQDAVTMVIMVGPLAVLYLASIWLVAFVERLRDRRSYRPSYDTP